MKTSAVISLACLLVLALGGVESRPKQSALSGSGGGYGGESACPPEVTCPNYPDAACIVVCTVFNERDCPSYTFYFLTGTGAVHISEC